MGLPYVGPAQNKKKGVYESKIKNYGKAYRLITLISSGIGISFGLIAGFIDGFSNYVSALLVLWISVALVGNYFISKYRNVLAKDMNCPFIECKDDTKNIDAWKKAKADMKAAPKKEKRLVLIVLLILAAIIIGAVAFMVVMISQH